MTPQKAAGWRIEPPVSLPKASGLNPAATAAAEPPDDPPGTRLVSHGLCVGPKAEFSVDEPMANSSVFVLPSTTMPCIDQAGDAGGGVGRAVTLQYLRPCRGLHPLHTQHVLDGRRNAAHGGRRVAADLAPISQAPIGVFGLLERQVRRQCQKRVDLAVEGLDPVQAGAGQLRPS